MFTSIISKDGIGEEVPICSENKSPSVTVKTLETICQMQDELDQTELEAERCSQLPSLGFLSYPLGSCLSGSC